MEKTLLKPCYSGLLYEKWKDTPAVRGLNRFLYADIFYITVAVLCTIAFTYSWEPAVYTVYAAFMVGILLLGEKVERVLIVLPFFYIAPSVIHNPAVFPESVFRQPSCLIYMGAVMVLPILLTVLAAIRCAIRSRKRPSLWLGYLLLGVAYICSGQLSGGASVKNTAFALVELLSVSAFYFVGFFIMDDRDCDGAMFAKIGAAMGLALLVEITDIYLFSGVFAKGYWNRGAIFTGWGIYNNLGNMLCVCIPCAFYLMYRGRRKLLWFAYAVLLLVAVALTTSRGSLLTGGFLFAVAFLVTVAKLGKGKPVRRLLLALLAAVLVGVTAVILLWLRSDAIRLTVEKALKAGLFNDAGRFGSWKAGLAQFLEHPIFGKGFYECSAYLFFGGVDGLLPARWHNTVIELLACCGAVGLAAYGFHRIQTVWLVLRSKTPESRFAALSILGILLGSLTDNHFFNIGPGIVYGLFLAFINLQYHKNTSAFIARKGEINNERDRTV